MKKLLLCLSLIMVIGFVGCSDSTSNPKADTAAGNPKAETTADASEAETAAIAAAKDWLVLVDAEKYGESWDEAAKNFRNAVPKEKWTQAMEAMRKPFGKNISRELESKSYRTSLPGAPDGKYVVIRFKSSFENKKNAIETITPTIDKDGKWRVSGYFMK